MKNPHSFKEADITVRNDGEYILALLDENSLHISDSIDEILSYIGDTLKKDEGFLQKAAKKSHFAFHILIQAVPSLGKNEEFILDSMEVKSSIATEIRPDILRDIDPELKEDEDFMEKAIQKTIQAYKHLASGLKKNLEYNKRLLNQYSPLLYLQFDNAQQENRELALLALTNGLDIDLLPKSLQKDEEIAYTNYRNNPKKSWQLDRSLRKNQDFMFRLLKAQTNREDAGRIWRSVDKSIKDASYIQKALIETDLEQLTTEEVDLFLLKTFEPQNPESVEKPSIQRKTRSTDLSKIRTEKVDQLTIEKGDRWLIEHFGPQKQKSVEEPSNPKVKRKSRSTNHIGKKKSKIRTEKQAIEYVKDDGMRLGDLDKKWQSKPKVVKAAFDNNRESIQFASKSMKTLDKIIYLLDGKTVSVKDTFWNYLDESVKTAFFLQSI